ncbi:hypothetical protein AC1031_013525 [Aphanomyces cochlioides]|nr:hypothetical protein AC1031_013525 [Aphanomyces cochlioides]
MKLSDAKKVQAGRRTTTAATKVRGTTLTKGKAKVITLRKANPSTQTKNQRNRHLEAKDGGKAGKMRKGSDTVQKKNAQKPAVDQGLIVKANEFFLKLLMETPVPTSPRRHVLPHHHLRKKTKSQESVLLGEECRILTYDDDDSVEISRNVTSAGGPTVEISTTQQYAKTTIDDTQISEDMGLVFKSLILLTLVVDISDDSIELPLDKLPESQEFGKGPFGMLQIDHYTLASPHNFNDPFFESLITFASPPPRNPYNASDQSTDDAQEVLSQPSTPAPSISSFSSAGGHLSPLAVPSTPPPPLRRASIEYASSHGRVKTTRKSTKRITTKTKPKSSKNTARKSLTKASVKRSHQTPPSTRRFTGSHIVKSARVASSRSKNASKSRSKGDVSSTKSRVDLSPQPPKPKNVQNSQHRKPWHPLDVRRAHEIRAERQLPNKFIGPGMRVNQNALCSLQQLFMT